MESADLDLMAADVEGEKAALIGSRPGSNPFHLPAVARFLRDEEGQDLIEYTLLMAFIALASAAIFTNAGHSVHGVWSSASSILVTANSVS